MSQRHLCPQYCLSAETSAWLKSCVFSVWLIKVQCNYHLVPWLTSSCTRPWMMLGRHVWHKSEAHLPSTAPSCFSGSSVCKDVLIYQNVRFRLACVNLHLYNGNASIAWYCNFVCSSRRENAWSVAGFCALYVLHNPAYYPSSKIKWRAHIQFLWEFFWPLNLFCNHDWRIPRAT